MGSEQNQDGAPPAAAALAMNAIQGDSETAGDAREYLHEQTRLTRLQIEDMEREDQVRHWSVRVHHVSDVMKLAFQFAVGLVILLIVCGIGAMVWNAASDHDLVVDAFSVPPDIAQTGMTGKVLAGRVLDKFGTMQAGTFSTAQGAESYRGTQTSVRIEIPETGISIGELNQYLREWLGHETHVTGDLVHTKKGYALTIRYSARPGTTLDGDDLGKLVTQSAERIYAAAKPLRYANYLTNEKRYAEAEAVIRPLTLRGSARERALAYSAWVALFYAKRDLDGAMPKAKEAMRLDPKNPSVVVWLAFAELNLGHQEAALRYLKADEDLWKGEEASDMDAAFVAAMPYYTRSFVARIKGDYIAAVAAGARAATIDPQIHAQVNQTADAAAAHDIAAARDLLATLPTKTDSGKPSPDIPGLQEAISEMMGDWPAALAALKRYAAILDGEHRSAASLRLYLWPDLALAMAKTGDISGAEALIAKTPRDCDGCVIDRGRIAAVKHDWKRAAHWFALVSARTPSIPGADYYWGGMLMAKDDLDGAIAKFESAHKKGPRWADPLEYWGEALMAKNRSDLALVKFALASRYAPNWGRLHLKWGEALFYTGDKAGAQKQFAVAAKRDLAPQEKFELAQMTKRTGVGTAQQT